MQSVRGCAYQAALLLLDTCKKLGSKDDLDKAAFMCMIYPPGSTLDSSPLQMLCCNDTCSFTWTGREHIKQDIFECKTCGLTGSLCCCTECARVCHKGHDCKYVAQSIMLTQHENVTNYFRLKLLHLFNKPPLPNHRIHNKGKQIVKFDC